jgi:hypothetical protein
MIKAKKMKSIFTMILIIAVCFSGMAQPAGKARVMKPSNHTKRVTTIVEGKSLAYYSLSTSEPSVISVHGPGKLKLITRGRFTPKSPAKPDYSIRYTVNGGEWKSFKAKGVSPASKVSYLNESLGTPAQSESFIIELPRGNNTIEFFRSEDEVLVAARYIFTPAKGKKTNWVSYAPIRPCEPVELLTGENSVKYYRFSNKKPLKVEINGPTQLRVLTRIENHYQMKGRIHYRVQVKENSGTVNTYQLSSVHSQVTVYRDDKHLIPGKGCEFVINVPEGSHTYDLVLLDEDKNTVLGRMMIPKNDIKIE